MVNECSVLAERPEGKRQLGRSRRKCEDNIKTDLRKIVLERGDWINMAPDVCLNTVMKFQAQ
jgi:hypothetical protein